MTESEFTPWLPGTVNPARPGVYQRRIDGYNVWYSRWDGTHWYCIDDLPEYAAQETQPSWIMNRPWRGLKHNPNGGAV